MHIFGMPDPILPSKQVEVALRRGEKSIFSKVARNVVKIGGGCTKKYGEFESELGFIGNLSFLLIFWGSFWDFFVIFWVGGIWPVGPFNRRTL